MSLAANTPTVTCADVVDAYGAVLERINWQDRPIVLESELPFEKPLVKEALVSLATSPTPPVPVERLKAGFLELASFQDSVPSAHIPWSKIGKEPPRTKEELAKFFEGHEAQLTAQRIANEFILAEYKRLEKEWDSRIQTYAEAAE